MPTKIKLGILMAILRLCFAAATLTFQSKIASARDTIHHPIVTPVLNQSQMEYGVHIICYSGHMFMIAYTPSGVDIEQLRRKSDGDIASCSGQSLELAREHK